MKFAETRGRVLSKGTVAAFDLAKTSMATMNAGLCVRFALLFLIAAGSPALATGLTHVLNPGRYRIDVIVENPKSGQQQTVRQVERCLKPEAIANHIVFEMLSDTPASACPKYEVCAGEFRTGFIARCTSERPRSAVGMFALEPNEFRGRIEVKNGDGKLTNVEIQYGERVGNCDPER